MSRSCIALVALFVVTAACSGGGGDQPDAVASRGGVETTGLELFEERVVGANPGCVTCHSFAQGTTLVGPSLAEVDSRVPGLTTAEYIRQSIIDPDGYVVEGFTAGQMSAGWDDCLTAEQIESLVKLLLRS